MDILREFADTLPTDTPPKSKYTLADTGYAVAAFILGLCFVRWIFFSTSPALGVTVFALLAVAAAVTRFAVMHRRITHEGILWAISTLAFGTLPTFASSDTSVLLATLLSALSFLMLCIRGGYASDCGYLLVDAVKALFLPFSRMFAFFPSIIVPFTSGNKKSRRAALAVCGLLCALIPTCIVAFILMRADSAFEYVMDGLLDLLIPEVDYLTHGLIVFFGIPCGLYIFGAIFGATDLHETDDSRSNSRHIVEGARFVDDVFSVSALAPLCFIYLIFFFSQLGYFTSAFTSTLPEGFSVADYARRGFFDLCSVAGFNAVVIFITLIFTKRGLGTKIMLTVISVFTLGLAAIALAKMAMYIERWGMTVNRLYPTVFMLILVLCFILVIVSLWRPIRLVMLCTVITLSGVFTLLCADPDCVVAAYNVDRYLDGTLDTIDIHYYQYDLSPEAAVYLIPLLDDEAYAEAVTWTLNSRLAVLTYTPSAVSQWAQINVRTIAARNEVRAEVHD